MNPNSENQIWSKWDFFIIPSPTWVKTFGAYTDTFKFVKDSCARFGRELFGSPSMMNVQQKVHCGAMAFTVEIITEGHPVGDHHFRDCIEKRWRMFFKKAFGEETTLHMAAKLMAGKRDDGQPPDQMVILSLSELGLSAGD